MDLKARWHIRQKDESLPDHYRVRAINYQRKGFRGIPKHLRRLRDEVSRFVLPPRRSTRCYPRAVKIKMSNYERKRPVPLLKRHLK